MKIAFSIILALITLYVAAMFLDNSTEKLVYEFCQSHAVGNSVSELQQKAEIENFEMQTIDASTFVLTSRDSFSVLNQYTCEIKIQDEKIVSQAMRKE